MITDQNKLDELSKKFYEQILRFESIGITSLELRRNYLVSLFTVTALALGSLFLVKDLTSKLNLFSYIGLLFIGINLILIPFYIWLASRHEIIIIKRRADFFENLNSRIAKEKKFYINEGENNEFKNLFTEYKTKHDWQFDVINITYLLGIVIFFLSLVNFEVFIKLFK